MAGRRCRPRCGRRGRILCWARLTRALDWFIELLIPKGLIMKMLFGAAIGCVMFTRIAGGQAAPAGLQPVLDDLLPAANAHDTDRFLASYLHDSTAVFVYNGVVITGFSAIRELQVKAWAKSDVVYTQHGAMRITTVTPDVVV